MFRLPPSVQSPRLAQRPGSDHVVGAGLQHSAVALPHPRAQVLPQTAAVLPPVDVRAARTGFQRHQSLGGKPRSCLASQRFISFSFVVVVT